jgi:lysophospholipase L1-like esterase
MRYVKLFRITTVLLVAVTTLSTALQPLNVSAKMSKEQKQALRMGALYYNTDACRPGGAVQPSSGSGSVYVLGDSITNQSSAKYPTSLSAKGFTASTVNGSDGRSITGKGTTGDKLSGLEAVAADAAKIQSANTVVVALGTNGGSTNANIQSIIQQIRSHNQAVNIFWVDTMVIGRPALAAQISSANKAIHESAAANNYRVISWAQKVSPGVDPKNITGNEQDSNGYIRQSDQYVHLNPVGEDALVALVAENITTSNTNQSGSGCVCTAGGGAAGQSTELSQNIPDVWRSLIAAAAPQYPDVNPNLVATVLWVENRGWPEFKTSGWGVSNAGAAGPWQFISSSWASMGHDGDGDGRKDRDNPYDAVHAAFKHHQGSAGKPIAAEFDGNAESSFQKIIFRRDNENLLSYAAKYNGGAKTGPRDIGLKDFPRGENADYIILSYWLLATDFQKTWKTTGSWGEFVDATSAGGLFGGTGSSTAPSGSITGFSACGGASGSTVEGFPLQTTKATIKDGIEGMKWCYENQSNCHHDYNAADIFVPTGTKVVAVKSGTVLTASDVADRPSSSGSRVTIKGDDDNIYYYAHMGAGTLVVEKGQTITAGTVLGEVGTNANAMGTPRHLHFDILPPPHTSRVSCAAAACSSYPFIEVQPGLVDAYNKLPEN